MTRRQLLAIGATVVAGGLVGGARYTWQSNTLSIEEHSRTLWDFPRPIRLAIVSDLHAPNYRVPLIQLVDEVNRAHCDLLIILGDSIDRGGNEHLVQELFASMKASIGKFSVLGNWEYRRGVDRQVLRRFYEAANVQLLVNEEIRLRGSQSELRIVGLDDYLEGEPDLALAHKEESLPTVVLSHCPALAPQIAERARVPALVLSGHTHGGQIAPFGVALYLPPGSGPFVKGWYTIGQSELYVSPGIGNSGVPLRVGVQPTLALIDIA